MHAVTAFLASIVTFVSGLFGSPHLAAYFPVDVPGTQPAAAAAARTEIADRSFMDTDTPPTSAAASPPPPLGYPPPSGPAPRVLGTSTITVGDGFFSQFSTFLRSFDAYLASPLASGGAAYPRYGGYVPATNGTMIGTVPANTAINTPTITSPTITGGSITNTSIAGYLPLSGGALTGPLTGTNLSLSGALTATSFSGSGTSLYSVPAMSYAAHHAFGDSITVGSGASPSTNAYASLLAAAEGATLTNYAASGRQSCDVANEQVFPNENPGYANNPIYTVMIGANDTTQHGAGDYESVYKLCHLASVSWLAIPSTNKVFGQSSGCTQTGSWAADNTYQSGIGIASTANGSTLSCSITSTGGPLYLWYRIMDGNGGEFSYQVDGGAPVAATGYTSTPLATWHSTQAVGLARIPNIAAGSHTVTITVTSPSSASNIVSILGVGTVSSLTGYQSPRVFVGGVMYRQNGDMSADSAAYNADAQSDATLLAGDGLPVYFVDVRAYVNGTTDMSDTVHPNNTGHAHLFNAFAAAEQFTPSTLGVLGGFFQNGSLLLYASTTNQTTSVGLNAGAGFTSTSTPLYSVAIGNNALSVTPTNGATQFNTAVGVNALQNNTSGSFNTALGYSSMITNTTGTQNTGLGRGTLQFNTTGSYNTAAGLNALQANTTGSFNTALGRGALLQNQSATNTVAVGYFAGSGGAVYSNQGGTLLGYQAGFGLRTGSDYNTLVGYQAGYGITTGSNNIWIGTATSSTGVANLTTGSQNILIGNNISLPSATASGQLNIGNIIYGTGITGTGSTLSTGNVGIGTTSPAAKLHVDDSSYNYQLLLNNSAVSGNTVIGFTQNGSSAKGAIGIAGAANGLLTGSAANDLVIRSNTGTNSILISANANTPQMLVTSTGNIGIGTTSPSARLDVGGYGSNELGFTPNNAIRLFDNYNGVSDISIKNINTNITAASAFQAFDSGGSYVSLTMPGTGNTAAPLFGLARASTTYLFSNTVGANPARNLAIGTLGANSLTFGTNNAARLTIDSSGNVGVGTTTPWGKLSIAGAGTGTGYAFIVADSSNTTRFTVQDNGSVTFGGNTITNSQNSAQISMAANIIGLRAANSGNAQLTILNAGNVGIGTTTPTAQLSTTGTVRFSNFGAGSLTTDASGNLSVSSDERLKNIDGAFSRGLADIVKLSPIQYHWNALSGLDTSTQYAGFSAQNVQQAIPEAVGSSTNGYLTLQDRPLIAALVNAVKELSAKLDMLNAALSGFAERFSTQLLAATRIEARTASISGELCARRSDGADVCVTADQLAALLSGNGSSYTITTSSNQPAPPLPEPDNDNSATITATTTPTNDQTPPADDQATSTPSVSDFGMTPGAGANDNNPSNAYPADENASTTPAEAA